MHGMNQPAVWIFLLPVVSMAEFGEPGFLLQLLKEGIGMHGELTTAEGEGGEKENKNKE